MQVDFTHELFVLGGRVGDERAVGGVNDRGELFWIVD